MQKTHTDIISREQDGFYLTFFFFFWYQKEVYVGLCILVGGRAVQATATHPNSSQFVTLSLTYWRALLSSEGLSLEDSHAQCNGYRGDVGGGTQRTAGIIFPPLKLEFMGFVT